LEIGEPLLKEPQGSTVPPWDFDGFIEQPGGENDGKVRTAPLGVLGASDATALFILLTIGASRVAGPAASGVSTRRFSFCCAVDGCRSRATPPSLRFLGPKVYIAAIVVLIAVLRHGATALRMRELLARSSSRLQAGADCAGRHL
jgi:hypothetical protein